MKVNLICLTIIFVIKQTYAQVRYYANSGPISTIELTAESINQIPFVQHINPLARRTKLASPSASKYSGSQPTVVAIPLYIRSASNLKNPGLLELLQAASLGDSGSSSYKSGKSSSSKPTSQVYALAKPLSETTRPQQQYHQAQPPAVQQIRFPQTQYKQETRYEQPKHDYSDTNQPSDKYNSITVISNSYTQPMPKPTPPQSSGKLIFSKYPVPQQMPATKTGYTDIASVLESGYEMSRVTNNQQLYDASLALQQQQAQENQDDRSKKTETMTYSAASAPAPNTVYATDNNAFTGTTTVRIVPTKIPLQQGITGIRTIASPATHQYSIFRQPTQVILQQQQQQQQQQQPQEQIQLQAQQLQNQQLQAQLQAQQQQLQAQQLQAQQLQAQLQAQQLQTQQLQAQQLQAQQLQAQQIQAQPLQAQQLQNQQLQLQQLQPQQVSQHSYASSYAPQTNLKSSYDQNVLISTYENAIPSNQNTEQATNFPVAPKQMISIVGHAYGNGNTFASNPNVQYASETSNYVSGNDGSTSEQGVNSQSYGDGSPYTTRNIGLSYATDTQSSQNGNPGVSYGIQASGEYGSGQNIGSAGSGTNYGSSIYTGSYIGASGGGITNSNSYVPAASEDYGSPSSSSQSVGEYYDSENGSNDEDASASTSSASDSQNPYSTSKIHTVPTIASGLGNYQTDELDPSKLDLKIIHLPVSLIQKLASRGEVGLPSYHAH